MYSNTIKILILILTINIFIRSNAIQYQSNDYEAEGRRRHNRRRRPCGKPRDAEGRKFFNVHLSYLDIDHNMNYICGNQYPQVGPVGFGYPPGGGGYYGGYPSPGYPGGYPQASPAGGGGGGGQPSSAASPQQDAQELGCGLFGNRPCRPGRPQNNRPTNIRPLGEYLGDPTTGGLLGSILGDNPIGSIGNQLSQLGQGLFGRPPISGAENDPGAQGQGQGQIGLIPAIFDAIRPSSIFQGGNPNRPLFDGSFIGQFLGGNGQPVNSNPVASYPQSYPSGQYPAPVPVPAPVPAPVPIPAPAPAPAPSYPGDEDKPIHQDYDEVLPDDVQNLKPGQYVIINSPLIGTHIQDVSNPDKIIRKINRQFNKHVIKPLYNLLR